MTSHELRILSVKSRKENLRLSREHELRIWDEAEIIKKKKKKKEPRKSKSKSKWSNQKKTILPSDVEKQRAERARARPIMRREKRQKRKPRTQLQTSRGMMRREKKNFRGETVRVRDIQYYREGELEWGRELCSSNIRVMIWSRPKRYFFFFLYTQSSWYRTTWKLL